MTAFDRSGRFEQELPDILTAIAAPRVPDYVDDLLAQAAATRQRPRWAFLERWLPMSAIARRSTYFPSVPWRPILVAALVLVLAVAALLIAGSQRHVPPPFGPARNGALVFDDHGDIAIRDSLDGTTRTLVSGPTVDFAAGFTRDGTHLTFLRQTKDEPGDANDLLQMVIADADGNNARPLSDGLIAPDWADLSPDGQTIVVQAGAQQFGEHLYVIDVASDAAPRKLDLPMTTRTPNFLGPTGAEVVFRGVASTKDGVKSGIFAIHPDGSGLRPISPTDGDRDNDYQFPQPSQDGRYVTYTEWSPAANQLRIHLLDLTSGEDRTLLSEKGQGWASFSPDSKQIVFLRFVGDTRQVFVQPVDGSAPPLAMGPAYPGGDQDLGGTFSPDGRSMIVKNMNVKESRLVDVATGGDGHVLDWAKDGFTGWQRLAP
jgi:Tol biopolymer transport system component